MRKLNRVVFLSIILSTPVFSDPIRFAVTDHLMYSVMQDLQTNDSKNLLMHSAQVQGEVKEYRLGVEFANRFATDAQTNLNKNFVLEKKGIEAQWQSLNVTLGDTHQTFGKGIALALYRDPVFGIDNTVEGAMVQWKPHGFGIQGFGGRLNSLKAPVAQQPESDRLQNREVLIAGGSASVVVAEDAKVGAHSFYASQRDLDSSQIDKSWTTVGVSAEKNNLFDSVDLYAETNVLSTQLLAQSFTSVPTGYGSYGSATWVTSPWKVVLEGKDYRNYKFDFRRPPTLEEDLVQTLNIQNVSAARLQVEHTNIDSKVTLLGSYLGGEDRDVHSLLHHGVVGARFPLTDTLQMETRAGYRLMPAQNNLAHAGVKSKLKTFKGQSVELGYRKQVSNDVIAVPEREDRNYMDLTYTFSENMSTSLGYEYLPYRDASEGKHFASLSVLWKMGALTARGFAGRTSGGTQCSGGICRRVPPFSGAMVETTYVF